MDVESASWLEDQLRVQQILSGGQEHFDALYDAYFPRVYRFALKRLGDPGEAEDITQEVFMTLLKALPSYRGQSSLLSWVFGITRNKVNRRFRKYRPRLNSIDEEGLADLAAEEPGAEASLEARRLLECCQKAIQKELTETQRRIFELKHFKHQSIRSIAKSLGKSEDAIKANLYRMRRALSDATPGLESLIRN